MEEIYWITRFDGISGFYLLYTNNIKGIYKGNNVTK